jgi:toxin ParE1/3/4
MARLLWDQAAATDLEEIWFYIAVENAQPEAGDRLIRAIREKAESYARQPGMGTLHPELSPDIRSFRVGNYVAFYLPLSDGIIVLRVLHGAQDYPRFFSR